MRCSTGWQTARPPPARPGESAGSESFHLHPQCSEHTAFGARNASCNWPAGPGSVIDRPDLQVPSPTTSADDVSQTTAKHEKAAKGERIAADDPLDVVSRQTKSSLHRGQRHVDDREVQEQHELRRAKRREYQIRAMSFDAGNQLCCWFIQIRDIWRQGRDLSPGPHNFTRSPDPADLSTAAMTSWRRTASAKSGTA